MPKYNYSKTLIYQLICPTFDGIYVNHTCNARDRKYCYTYNVRLKRNNFCKTIEDHGGFHNWKMIILEEYHDCKTAEEAKERVKEWVNRLSPPATSNSPPTSSPQIHCNACKKCGKTFTRQDNLQRHILKRCSVKNGPPEGFIDNRLEKENETLREALAKKDEQFAKTIEAMKQEFKNELNTIFCG